MAQTPIYGLRYQVPSDSPDGATLGLNLASDVEDELVRIDAAAATTNANLTAGLEGRLQLIDAVECNVAATQVSSAAVELDLPRLAMPSIPFVSGALYRLDVGIINSRSVVSDEYCVRLRHTTAVSGTLLGETMGWTESGTAGRWISGFIFFDAPSTATLNLFLSVVRTGGTGAITIYYQTFNSATRTRTALYRVAPSAKRRLIIA